ncbi:aspartate kinase [candidate division KSB1 bacterium]
MKVYKFGGGSLKDSDSIKNLVNILKTQADLPLVVVISALGKTTNALEELTNAYLRHPEKIASSLKPIKEYHFEILKELFPSDHTIFKKMIALFDELENQLQNNPSPSNSYDYEYDQIVSYGELFSTVMISNYLNDRGIKNKWFDARELIQTDNTYREGRITWDITQQQIIKILKPFVTNNDSIAITQGFIGNSENNKSITLGREGSDYSAAIIAYAMDASEVTIWKDVPGLLNADPKYFKETLKLDQISYHEAIELAYYGATIIHPKTIKPLQNKQIPLKVKSFEHPEKPGSLIYCDTISDSIKPSYIFKKDQVLISVSPHDFSFIAEENLGYIFQKLAAYRIKVNMMQNSAISFSVCVDNSNNMTTSFIKDLQKNFSVRYNKQLELITIRHYDQETINKVVGRRKIILEQKSRSTVQLVLEG